MKRKEVVELLRAIIEALVQKCDRLRDERDDLQRSLDLLHGAKFSDRTYIALLHRAEIAEAEVERLRNMPPNVD